MNEAAVKRAPTTDYRLPTTLPIAVASPCMHWREPCPDHRLPTTAY